MDRRSAVWIHFDREDHTGRSLDLSARLAGVAISPAVASRAPLHQSLDPSAWPFHRGRKRNARCNAHAPLYFVSMTELLSQSGYVHASRSPSATLTSRYSVGAIFLSRLDRRFHSERRRSSSDLNLPRKLWLRLRG
jgi:hypothetical protein